MSKKVELIIGDYPNEISLDLTANAITIALQYSIDDVRNIDKKNSNYSKNITVPGTKKNNDAFGNLFDVNSTYTQFNPNKKINSRIVIDSSPVLEGYLQLTAVNKMNNADLQGNLISYNVIVFDDSIDFIQTLGDKKVNELDFSTLDHEYGSTAIENAWNNHTYSDIYQYPMLDKDTQGYETTDFKPAFYHKGLLLKIADDAGYTLTGSFITGNAQYEKEIIAWDGHTPTITDSQALLREYKAALTGGSTLMQFKNFGTYDNFAHQFQEQETDFDDIATPGYFDNTGGYTFNLGTPPDEYSQWEVIDTGKYNFNLAVKAGMSYFGRGVQRNAGNVVISNNNNYLKLRAVLRDATTGTHIQSKSYTLGNLESLTTSNPADPKVTKVVENDVNITFNDISLNAGDKVRLYLTLINDVAGSTSEKFAWTTTSGGGYAPETVDLTFYIEDTLDNGVTSYWGNETVKQANIQAGDNLELNLYLPKEIKQKDLLSDIIRRYNVYVRKHPTLSKTLILETRDNFYKNNVTTLDWTQKKDYSSEDKIEFLSDLQNKEILFTYKEADGIEAADGGKYNEAYTTSTGDIYGQKKVSFDNDFVQGTKKIESIFSTVPLVYRGLSGNDVVVPAIKSTEDKRKSVLLYWGGLTTIQDENGLASTVDITWGLSTNTPTSYSTYPYAGHYDNPYAPLLDIHYGEVTYEYYGILLSNVTDNNLFNQEWRNYINQIADGKLVTSKFYLRETDINFIKDNLNSRIFVKDSYYIINKIVDYKPLEDRLTTVELSRIEQGSDFFPTYTPPVLTLSTFGQVISSQTTKDTNSSGPFRSNVTNTVRSSDAVVVGENNSIGGGTTAIVNGNNNVVGGDTTGVNITGSDNVVIAGSDNVTIIGDGITVDESNTTVIGGLTIQDGKLVSGTPWVAGDGLDSAILNQDAGNTCSTLGENSVVSGVNNDILTTGSDVSSILGGFGNQLSGIGSAIIGGTTNLLTGDQSAIIGGINNTLSVGNSAIIAGNNITLTIPNTVAVPAITFGNEDTPWKFIELEIGDWNMLGGAGSITMNHSLSATEWKTIRQMDAIIRNDSDTTNSPITAPLNSVTFTQSGGIAVGSLFFILSRSSTGLFFNASYSTTSYNRGFVTFWYKPD